MLVSGSSSLASMLGASALSRLERVMGPKAADAANGAEGLSASPTKSARDEFLEYQQMTPAQKMRAAILAKLGVTEEELKAMDADERQKIEDKIKDMIKEELLGPGAKDNDRKGALVDLKA